MNRNENRAGFSEAPFMIFISFYAFLCIPADGLVGHFLDLVIDFYYGAK